VLQRHPREQYGFRYHDLVNQLRARLPRDLDLRWRPVTGIAHGANGLVVTVRDDEPVEARLVVLATGAFDALQSNLGITKHLIRKHHSLHFGFDVEPLDGEFPFGSLTYHATEARCGIDFITLFRVPGAMRANLFTYWEPSSEIARRMVAEPERTLAAALPLLERACGRMRISSTVQTRALDLRTSTGTAVPGLVVVGDAFQTTCPSTGTGLSKVLTDVDVLLDSCIRDWLATPGMGEDKIAQYYADPRKRAMDARSLAMALKRRRVAVDIPDLNWRALSLRRSVRRRLLAVRNSVKPAIKHWLWRAAPRAFNRLVPYHGQQFSIAIFHGASPFTLSAPEGASTPVLAWYDVRDRPAAFVADPFMVRREGCWYMFCEIFDSILRKGVIGLATSTDGANWTYERVVLEEPFHLAYPHVIEVDGAIYMVPDTADANVRLYRATRFPYEWQFVKVLVAGEHLSDSTLFRHGGRWWLLSASIGSGRDAELLLFSATTIEGPWEEHPASPVASGPSTARPAGRVIVLDGQCVRFAQHGVPDYGSRVRAFEVLDLSETTYAECEVPASHVLAAGAEAWRRGGMHHVDAHELPDGSWIACVDGWQRADSNS
jgi:2-polyprenyl-6-methoxyphenol hydroxylase-like FAD-dependent oxidoreductase